MKKIVALSIFLCVLIVSSAFAQQNKVVVVPLNTSKSNNVQHYRTTEQLGTASTGCITNTLTTPGYDTEAVLHSNISITPTANGNWWFGAQYSTDGGTSWNYVIPDLRTISGAISGTSTNSSEVALMDLSPNTDYIFRLNIIMGVTHSGGQCELFISFNRTATSDIVTVNP